MNKIKAKITAKKSGRVDYMGRAWYTIFVNGEAILKNGQEEKWKALDEEHAIDCFKQFNKQYA